MCNSKVYCTIIYRTLLLFAQESYVTDCFVQRLSLKSGFLIFRFPDKQITERVGTFGSGWQRR